MIKILKNLTKTEFLLGLLVVALTCAQTFLDLTLPDYMSKITMLVQTQGSAMGEILGEGGKMLLCAFGGLACAVMVSIIAARIASNFSYIVRGRVFDKVMGLSMKDVNGFSTASLITRNTNDITQIQILIVMGMQMLIKAPITAVWAIAKISGKEGAWSVVTVVAVAVLLCIISACMSLAVPRFKKLQVLTDNINRVAREHLDGLAVVRAYNAEDYQNEKFEVANGELTRTHVFTGRTMSFLMPSIQMISSGLVLAVYLVGAVVINEAVGMEKMVLFSDMVVFSAYAMQVIMAFMMLSMVFMILPRASVAAKRINEVLDTENTIPNGTKTSGIPGCEGEIVFENVSFRYPDSDDDMLKNISFTAKKGEVVAFIGSTGCGKTTVVNLIPRFYDATEGRVLVDGIDVREYDKNALNSKIGYVSQKSVLFTGTVKSNIVFGDNADLVVEENHLGQVVETSQAKEFVDTLSQKEEAYVAQGGRNLSGGQKQRLSIARAIYRKPEILIFDDSFSALDYKTDRVLRTALDTQCAGSTRIIVGQRIGTIRDADKIIVLEDGKIVGMGKHLDLLKTCDTYYQIGVSQLSEEELNHG